ncbi:Eco57I restriction-modification methylase domain-containing protein [Fusobacterium sp. THCT1E2]
MKEEYNYSIYTPHKIAKEIIEQAFNCYFGENKTLIKLKNVKLGDLSCGNGNLLLIALEKLLEISKEITGEYFFVDSWITGFDINEEAVKLTMIRGRELLKKHRLVGEVKVLCCNSLEIENMKFNILLGNPPYLGEKNNKSIFQEIRKTEFGKKYYEARMDYFYFFIEKGIEILENNGIMAYITTNYWLRADSGKKLRQVLRENGNFIEIKNYDNSVFTKAVGQHNIIFLWEKDKKKDKKVRINIPEKDFEIKNSLLYDDSGKIVLADEEALKFNKKILKMSNYKMEDLVNVNQGIVSGLDEAYIFEEYKEEFKEFLKPFYKNKDIGKYTNKENSFWILYLDEKTVPDEAVMKHLAKYQNKLSQRREVKTGSINWWELQWAREREIFTKPKILVRQRCKINQFSYDEGEFYGSADIYFITKKSDDLSLFYILGYINSEVFLQWFKYNGKIKGKNFEFYSTPLKETPIYYSKNKKDVVYIEELVKKQIKEFSQEREKEINNYFRKKMM